MDISEKKCLFTMEQIENEVKEMYPSMDPKEVYYHAQHVEDNDWLKISDRFDELETIIREQVGRDEE